MRLRCTAALAAATALLSLTACAPEDDTEAKPKTSATTKAKPSQSVDLDKIKKDLGYPPEADAATTKAYRAALDAIDPDIAHGKTDKAVSHGRDTCRAYKTKYDGKAPDRAKLIELTNLRFTSPNHPEGHGIGTAEKILDAVHKHLCPDY